MVYKLILWLLSKIGRGEQKTLVLRILTNLVNSEDSSIDNFTAEKIITLAIKSRGNKVKSFIIED